MENQQVNVNVNENAIAVIGQTSDAPANAVPVQTIALPPAKEKREPAKDARTVVGKALWSQLKDFTQVSEEHGKDIAEALQVSGANWQTEKSNIYTADGIQIPDQYAIRRLDTKAVLGISGKNWTPIPNFEKFAMVEPLLKSGLATIVGVGEFNQGEKLTIVLRFGETEREVRQGDIINAYGTITDFFNGRQGARVNLVVNRLACWNGMVSKTSLGETQIRHSTNGKANLEIALHRYHNAMVQYEENVGKMTYLAGRQIKPVQLLPYFSAAMDFSGKANERGEFEINTRSKNVYQDLVERFESTKFGLGKGTWYDAYQSVLEYYTHKSGRTPATRLDGLLHGVNGDETTKALQIAMDMSA